MTLPTTSWVFTHRSTMEAVPQKATGRSALANSLLTLSSHVTPGYVRPTSTGTLPSGATLSQFLNMRLASHLSVMVPSPSSTCIVCRLLSLPEMAVWILLIHYTFFQKCKMNLSLPSKYLFPLKLESCYGNPLRHGIRRQKLLEVIGSWWWTLHCGIRLESL